MNPRWWSFARGRVVPHRYHNSISQESPWGLGTSYVLLPSWLAARGYDTYMVGKWDVGHHTWAHTPNFRGFDEVLE